MRAGRLLFGTAAAIALGGSAQAAPAASWYLGIEAGAVWVQDQSITEKFIVGPTAASYPLDVRFEGGWAVAATIGYDWGDLRLEAEAGHRDNGIKDLPSCPGCWASPSLKDLTLMANALYDIPLASNVTLSLGVGIGADHARFNTGGGYFADEEWRFAYQAIGGFSYDLTDRAAFVVNYRYVRMSDPTFSTSDVSRTAIDMYDDIEMHTLTVGMRFALQSR
jgi:opacity protein-like surface antigen